MNRVGVIGSLNIDKIIQIDRIPEAGENILLNSFSEAFGGKGGNSAIALRKLNCDVCFFGCLGDDENSKSVKANLEKNGINSSNIKISKNFKTGTSYIFVESNGDNRIIVDIGANYDINEKDIENIFNGEMGKCSYILIQLEIPNKAIKKIISECSKRGIKLIVDAGPVKEIEAEIFKDVYILSPNKSELESLVKRKLETMKDIEDAANELLDLGIKNVLVKIGEKGSLFFNGNYKFHQKPYKVEALDTTGAGDSYMAGLVKALSENKNIEDAMNYAGACGAIATTKIGAASAQPTEEELIEFLEKY